MDCLTSITLPPASPAVSEANKKTANAKPADDAPEEIRDQKPMGGFVPLGNTSEAAQWFIFENDSAYDASWFGHRPKTASPRRQKTR
ncbi:MAG TPA: hypothetical protein VMH87_19385 [Pseudomonadales bacterium]|nr:hypothetical protein [Pseudomonadales bacterium]